MLLPSAEWQRRGRNEHSTSKELSLYTLIVNGMIHSYDCWCGGVFKDGSETGIPSKNSMFVTSRIDIDHQISHLTPQTAPYGFMIENNTELEGSLVQLIDINSAETADAICSAACNTVSNCAGWNLYSPSTKPRCALLSDKYDGNALRSYCFVML